MLVFAGHPRTQAADRADRPHRELAVHVHVVVVDGRGRRHLVGRQPRRVVQRRPVVTLGQQFGGFAQRPQYRVGIDQPRVDHLAGELQPGEPRIGIQNRGGIELV